MFSTRSRFVREPNVLARALADQRRAGRELLDLTLSNPTEAGLPYESSAISSALSDPGVLRYAPCPFGMESARVAVQRELARDGIEVDPDRVVLTASTSEAYAFAFALLCDPGDQVLVPEPSYPLLAHLAQLACVELRPYRLAYDGAWHIDIDSVRRALTPESRAIVLINPNNPTGSFVKRDELATLSALGLPLLSDEVFSRYAFFDDPTRAPSALASSGDALVIALGGLSKLAALPQLKLAWMLLAGADSAVVEARERLELVADTYLSVSAGVQLALPALFDATRSTCAAIRARTSANLRELRARLQGSAAHVLHVEGGWYAVVRLPEVASEEEWVVAFVERGGVCTQPGWFFDFEAAPYVVLSLLTPEASFGAGVSRIAEIVAEACR